MKKWFESLPDILQRILIGVSVFLIIYFITFLIRIPLEGTLSLNVYVVGSFFGLISGFIIGVIYDDY